MNKKFEKACIEAGKRILFEDIFDSFYRNYLMTPTISEMDWIVQVLRCGEKLPTYMSVDEFIEEFGDELHSMYKKLGEEYRKDEDEDE